MNIKQIIKEEIGDFDWAKGDVYFTIDDIIGKQMYYRKNNLSDLENKGISLTDLNRGDVELGDIRWSDGWVVEKVLENNMCLLLLDKGKTTAYKKESVESYVNLGAWVLVDQNGNILNDLKNKNIREEMGGLDWIKDEELPILPYIGKRFKLIRDDGQDSGRRYQILEYYFEDKYNKDFYVKSVLLNPHTLEPKTKFFHSPMSRAMELINNGNWVFLDTINESQDDFDWIRDSDPIEVINLNDEWHVNTIKEGDKLEITGKYDGIEFYNEPCEVVCVSTCSHRKAGNAWNHQILISFEREFYSKETDEETHCGPDYISEKKCNCREVDGVISHDGEPFLVGTCWWVSIPSLDEVVRINTSGINE